MERCLLDGTSSFKKSRFKRAMAREVRMPRKEWCLDPGVRISKGKLMSGAVPHVCCQPALQLF
jgi:hypothetical protein